MATPQAVDQRKSELDHPLTEAVTARVTGFAYDRWGAAVLYTLAPAIVAVPALALSGSWAYVLTGIVIWGAVTGVQDSTVKALVADLVPQRRLATAYGVFAAFQGVAALGRRNAGWRSLHRAPRPSYVLVALAQVLSTSLLWVALQRRGTRTPT